MACPTNASIYDPRESIAYIPMLSRFMSQSGWTLLIIVKTPMDESEGRIEGKRNDSEMR